MFFLRGVVESSKIVMMTRDSESSMLHWRWKKREKNSKNERKLWWEEGNAKFTSGNHKCLCRRTDTMNFSFSLSRVSFYLSEKLEKIDIHKISHRTRQEKISQLIELQYCQKSSCRVLTGERNGRQKNFISLIENNSIFKSMDEVFPFIV